MDDRARRFHACLDPLLHYAASQLGHCGDAPSGTPARQGRCLRRRARMLDALWTHRELIDGFVAANPARLAADDLAEVALWRHAVCDAFSCIDVLPSHVVAANDKRLFVIRPLGPSFERSIRSIPSLVVLTLLPFDGVIVTDGRVTCVSERLGADGPSRIREQLASAAGHPPIETTEQLVAYACSNITRSLLPVLLSALSEGGRCASGSAAEGACVARAGGDD